MGYLGMKDSKQTTLQKKYAATMFDQIKRDFAPDYKDFKRTHMESLISAEPAKYVKIIREIIFSCPTGVEIHENTRPEYIEMSRETLGLQVQCDLWFYINARAKLHAEIMDLHEKIREKLDPKEEG